MTARQYADAAWRRTRRAILARDGHRCQIRGPRCRGTATAVDHIVPVSKGGRRLDPSNLRAACVPCNTLAGNLDRLDVPHSERW